MTNTVIQQAINLCNAVNKNIETVGEGVETEQQLQILKEYGCDIGQGFLFGRPMPLDQFRELLVHERTEFNATEQPLEE